MMRQRQTDMYDFFLSATYDLYTYTAWPLNEVNIQYGSGQKIFPSFLGCL